MRYQSSGSCTYATGYPSQVSYLVERKRSAMRQTAFARARMAPKRKHSRDDENEHEPQQFPATQVTSPRITIDEFGNRKVIGGLKRLRVSSPPHTTGFATTYPADDVAMEDSDSEDRRHAIVTTKRPLTATVSPVAKKFVAKAVSDAIASDPACRAMVVFDPHVHIEPMPRIEFPPSDNEDESESDDDANFVRFEELPDDYVEEPEAMEID